MNDEEQMSWLDFCPVCGDRLFRIGLPLRQPEKYCRKLHGEFKIIDGVITFKLHADTPDV